MLFLGLLQLLVVSHFLHRNQVARETSLRAQQAYLHTEQVLRAKQEFILSGRKQASFFEEEESPYLEKYQTVIQALQTDTEALHQLLQNTTQGPQIANVQNLVQTFDEKY